MRLTISEIVKELKAVLDQDSTHVTLKEGVSLANRALVLHSRAHKLGYKLEYGDNEIIAVKLRK